MDRANSGKTNESRPFIGLNPPLSKMGTYLIEPYGLLTGMLIDEERVYPFSPSGIGAIKLIDDHEGTGQFTVTEELWSIRTLDIMEGEGIAMLGDDPVLTHGMVIFSKSFTSVATNQNTVHIIGVDPETGGELWRYTAGVARPQVRMILHNDQLYVNYTQVDENQTTTPVLMRITPGEDTPGAMISGNDALQVSSFHTHDAAGADLLHFRRSEQHFAFSTETLAHEWTYQADEATHGPEWDHAVRDIVAKGEYVYFARGSGLVYSLDGDGNLRWTTQLEPSDNCAGSSYLSVTDDRLILTGLCFDEVAALDPATGDLLWREEFTFTRQIPPAVHRDRIYVSTIVEPTTTQQVTIIDTGTGALIGNLTEAPGTPAYSRLALANGNLYSIASGDFDGHQIGVSVYEEEPASFTTTITLDEDYRCAAYAESEIGLTLTVQNTGPGVARNGYVVLRTPLYPAEFTLDPPPGTTITEVTNGFRLDFGDMEPSAPIDIPVSVHLPTHYEVEFEASALTSVRNTAGENATDKATVTVFPAPRADLELTVGSIEVNQGIQDLDNSVPLIAERPALVRVYPVSNDIIHSLGARLYITAEIDGLSGTRQFTDLPVEPIRRCLSVFPQGADRDDLNQSFNFILPPQISGGIPTGPVTMRAVLDPTGVLDSFNQADATHTEDFHFTATAPICLLTFPVLTLDNSGEELIPPATIPRPIIRRAEALLPTPEILDYPQNNVLSKFPGSRPYEFDSGGSTNTARVNSKLWAQRFTSNTPWHCESRDGSVHYVGIIGEDVLNTSTTGNFNGYAMTPGSGMHFRLRGEMDPEKIGRNDPFGGMTLAHELGHNFFRRHVDCGDPLSIGFLVDWIVLDLSYHYHTCEFSPVSSDSYFGADLFDLNDPAIIPPSTGDSSPIWGDLMSYGDNRWTSDYTWRAIFDKLDRSRKSGEVTPSLEWYDQWREKSTHGREVLVHATIDEDGNAEFHYTLNLDGELIPQENREELAASREKAMEQESPFAFDVRDSDGEQIMSVPVEVSLGEDAGPPEVVLGALVPSPDDLASIQLVFTGGDVMVEAFRPANEPTVEITEPTDSTTADENIIVDWTATHPDKSDLLAMIQYSADGDRWQTIAADVEEAPHVLNAALLQGAAGTARIRVIVSDGFNTAHAVSDSFTVLPRDPIVSITRPGDGDAFFHGTPIFTETYAYDPEDGHLRGEALKWHIDGIGDVGEGHIALLQDLPVGTHRLVVQATDSYGTTVTDEIDITILPPPPTTVEISRVILGINPFIEGIGMDRNLDGALDAADLVEPEEE